MLVDTQPAWYYKDADALAAGLGRERLAHFIGLRTLRQAGVDVAINTDHMFGLDRDEALNPFNPFLTIYAATTRRTQSGAIVSGDEAVSREEALRMMTSAAARFSFDEKTRGSIEVGKLADFVVLDTRYHDLPARPLARHPAGDDGHRRPRRVRAQRAPLRRSGCALWASRAIWLPLLLIGVAAVRAQPAATIVPRSRPPDRWHRRSAPG